MPQELEARIAEWVEYYNNHKYHESLENVTQADLYLGRKEEILERKQRIKNRTLIKRRMEFSIKTYSRLVIISDNLFVTKRK